MQIAMYKNKNSGYITLANDEVGERLYRTGDWERITEWVTVEFKQLDGKNSEIDLSMLI